MQGLLFFALSFVALAQATSRAPVGALPGYTNPSGVSLSMESGYMTVNKTDGRAIFYWMVRSQDKNPNAPLVFWYTGGPGCSGLSALFTEHGPFTPNTSGGLTYNPLSWTKIANVVYLEQPAGVGFSYSNTSSNYNTGDKQAAIDNYAFVTEFLVTFPEFKGRDIWLTGESYAGEYIPALTEKILEHPGTDAFNQLKGFMDGNPVMFCGSMQSNAITLDILYWHGLVSYGNFDAFEKAGCRKNEKQNICDKIINTVIDEVGVIDQELRRSVPKQPSLDPDDLYQDFCTGNGTLEYPATVPVGCQSSGQLTTNYLNRRDVQQAIHAQGANGGLPAHWTICTNNINYHIDGLSEIPRYAKFPSMKPGIKILVYSGDIDILTVPFGFTKPCLAQLKRPVTKKWQPWFVNGQTAGYVEQFDTYTYATLKGAGHEGPAYQPLSAFNMFQRFMTQGNLDDVQNDRITPAKRPLRRQGQMLRQMMRRFRAERNAK